MLVKIGKRKSTKMAFLRYGDVSESKNSKMAFLASGGFLFCQGFCIVPEVLSRDFG